MFTTKFFREESLDNGDEVVDFYESSQIVVLSIVDCI